MVKIWFFTRKHIEILRKNKEDYTVSEKTDGYRYTLLLGKYKHDNSEYSVLIDRSFHIYELSVAATDFCFNGTAVDGELIIDLCIP